ncbi:MAG: hypothetical protein Q9201_004227 [Fulgogasparrea decipioides]
MASPHFTQPTTATFRLLDLPLEIRRNIFHLAFTSHKEASQSHRGSAPTRLTQCYRSLILTNHQISHETREILYGTSTFTVNISANETSFLHSKQYSKDFRPFKPTLSIAYIKHWQLDLQFDPSYNGSNYSGSPLAPHLVSTLGNDQYYIREGNLAVSIYLAEGQANLQTLKVRVPCLCAKVRGTSTKRVQTAVLDSLEPVKQFKVKGNVTILAVKHTHEMVNEPGGNSGQPRLVVAGTQCQEEACLAFAASFSDLARTLENQDIPRPALASRQQKWLEIKNRAATLLLKIEPQTRFCLFEVWTAMETRTDQEFEEKCEMAINWIDQQFDAQLIDGRYSRYSNLQSWRVPEEEW